MFFESKTIDFQKWVSAINVFGPRAIFSTVSKQNRTLVPWASTALSQALKPPGAPRLEATTPLVARGGFIFINNY